MRFPFIASLLLLALTSVYPTLTDADASTNAAVDAILNGTFNPPTISSLSSDTVRNTASPAASGPNTTTPSSSSRRSTHAHAPPGSRAGLFLQNPSLPHPLPPDKHFHEATFDNHYDGRFSRSPVNYDLRHKHLNAMIVAYLDTMRELGIETWLMHGTLLGWWWNKRILAWDQDVDVQVTTESLGFMGRYYNMSLWNFDTDGRRNDGGGALSLGKDGNETQVEFGRHGRTYLLEINPYHHLHDGGVLSDKNVIDGRWIDTETGLYVDITCLWKAVNHEAGSGILTGKDGHSFREKYIFPLRETSFEGTEALIPSAYMEVLSKEYGSEALVKGNYKGHIFDEDLMEWVSLLPSSTLP